MNYVKGNLLTLLSASIAVTLAVIMQLNVWLAFLIWLSAFMLDASYTFHKRKYLEYEMNIMVRRSKDKNLVQAFVKVVMVEFAMIAFLYIVLLLMDNNAVSISASLSAIFILFAVIHTLAFVRSYEFMKKRMNNR